MPLLQQELLTQCAGLRPLTSRSTRRQTARKARGSSRVSAGVRWRLDSQVYALLEALRDKYASLTYDEILAIDWRDLDPVTVSGKALFPAVWSFEHEDAALLVTQMQTSKFLGFIYDEWALGCSVARDGTRTDLTQLQLRSMGIV
jgi:hypothetical protein